MSNGKLFHKNHDKLKPSIEYAQIREAKQFVFLWEKISYMHNKDIDDGEINDDFLAFLCEVGLKNPDLLAQTN